MADLIIVTVFTIGIALGLWFNQDNIDRWAKSKHGKKLEWRQ